MNRPFPSRNLVVICLSILAGCGKSNVTNIQADRDRQFERMMSSSTMVGYSTRDNRPGLSGEEMYRIEKVSRLAGNTWLFQARMRYGSIDVPVPVPVTVEWAGDTPVITLTDMDIPGVGTYTARIVLYRDRYAGTWSGKSGGGQMFGKIVRGGVTTLRESQEVPATQR